MPEEGTWTEFFNINLVLSELEVNSEILDLVEIGCGYGTFTIPGAKLIKGKWYGFDIEKEMIDIVTTRLRQVKSGNVVLEQRDILAQTTGLSDNSIDYIMLFNILHHDDPNDFFNEAFRILKPQGKVGILHWRSDITTPRGPDLSIRPKPDQICKEPEIIEPYHFGLILSKL
jgi:ubiquinone/menaquinone biosynthesis C-methylase UbiE